MGRTNNYYSSNTKDKETKAWSRGVYAIQPWNKYGLFAGLGTQWTWWIFAIVVTTSDIWLSLIHISEPTRPY